MQQWVPDEAYVTELAQNAQKKIKPKEENCLTDDVTAQRRIWDVWGSNSAS